MFPQAITPIWLHSFLTVFIKQKNIFKYIQDIVLYSEWVVKAHISKSIPEKSNHIVVRHIWF